MRAAFRLCAYFALAIFATSCDAYAEIFQRMLLLSGTITVGGGGSGEIPSRCLDVFASTPERGLSYTSVATGLGSATVRVGSNPPIPLQQALQQGILSLEGFDGKSHTKLRITNPNPAQSVQIDVSSPTIVAPDESYPVDDLKGVYGALANYQQFKIDPPDDQLLSGMSSAQRKEYIEFQTELAAKIDNRKIWQLRRENASNAISPESRDKLVKAGLSAEGAAMYEALVRLNLKRSDPAFIVFRTSAEGGRGHAIFTGSGVPLIVGPFEPLGAAYAEARKRWRSAVGEKPTAMALAGRGSLSDFDVTNVLLAAAAGGSGGNGGIILNSPSGFPEPPKGWKPFEITNSTSTQLLAGFGKGPPSDGSTLPPSGSGGLPPAVLAGYEKRGPYKYTQKFSRGEATAYAKREITIATMAAAIRRFLRGDSVNTADAQAVLEDLKQEVQHDLDNLYRRVPNVREQEKGGRPGADLEATVDGSRRQWNMAVNSSDINNVPNSRSAVREANNEPVQESELK